MKSTTVNVSFSRGLLKTMDRLARQEAITRSEFLREAVRFYVEQRRRWKKIFRFWTEEARRSGLRPEGVEGWVAQARRRGRTA